MRNKFISIYWYSLPCGGPGLDYSPEGKNRPMPLPACCKLLKGGWVCGQVAVVCYRQHATTALGLLCRAVKFEGICNVWSSQADSVHDSVHFLKSGVLD